MRKNKNKPKFIPPIKTAASFLKSITEPNDSQKYELSPVLEFSPKSQLERLPSLNSPQLKKNSIYSTLKLARNKKSKSSRDVSHLKDLPRYSKLEIDIPYQNQIHILPTEIEKLKLYIQATSPSNHRLKSKTSQICFKSSCIENMTEEPKPFRSTSIEDFSSVDYGAPSGQNEILNLKEWFRFMKETILNKVIQNDIEKGSNLINPDGLADYELIVIAGLKEFLRQLHVLNTDRWEMLTELVQSLNLYWKVNLDHCDKSLRDIIYKDKYIIQALNTELQDKIMILKEKEIKLNKDFELLRVENLLKTEEIQKLEESVKKLKADRVYRTKQELQRYNQLSKCLEEFKPKEGQAEILKEIKEKKDSLTSQILNKIQMLQAETTRFSARLSDDQLIEYEMLITNTEDIFIEKSAQTDYFDFCRHTYTQTIKYQVEASCETDEILDVVVEEQLPKPVKNSKHFSILVTNELEENVLVLDTSLASGSNIDSSSRNSPTQDLKTSNNLNAEYDRNKRRRSVVGLYKTRITKCSYSQTDDEIFWDNLKKSEEEITEWILVDRRKKLGDLDRQIINSKKQLGKVNSFISQHKNQLYQSVNYEDEGLDLDSENSFDILLNTDLEYLKSYGIIGKDVDLPSWREGYKYGYEKGNLPKQEKLSDDSLHTDSDEDEVVNNTKTKVSRNSLGDEFLRTRKNTKIEEFNFQRKETKHHSFKPSNKPKFLENFIQTFKLTSKKVATMSKKNILKTIGALYSSAISKNSIFDLNPLHLFVYEEFLGKYITKSAVDKKILEFMTALVNYKDERKITIFNRMFGVSVKNDIPSYARPKQVFNFFIFFSRLLENSHHGIDVGEIKGKSFVPAIRAYECTKEVHAKFFEGFRLQVIFNSIDKNLVNDPNKINKNLIEKDVLLEILLEHYNDYNKGIEKFLIDLFEPFHYYSNRQKIHKLDFIMLLRYFDSEKYKKYFGLSPLESIEKLISHDRSKYLISQKKAIDLCFQIKILLPDEIREDLKKLFSEVDKELNTNEEIKKYEIQMKLIKENKEKMQLDTSFVNNWEHKILKLMENGKKLQNTEKIMWKILSSEIKRMTSEF